MKAVLLPRPTILIACTIAAIYFACAAVTLQLTRFDGGLAIVWPTGAVLLAVLSTSPRRLRPTIGLACLPAGIAAACLLGVPGVGVALGSLGVAEAFLACWLLKQFCPRFGRLQSLTEVGAFLLLAGFVVPGVGAALGAAAVHVFRHAPFWSVWRDWFAGHALGFITCTPPLLLCRRGELGKWYRDATPHDRGASAMLLVFVLAATLAAFSQNRVPLVMLPLIPMLAATFRLGRFGAVASILILISVGMTCSLMHLGPTTLLSGGLTFKIQVLQVYFASVVIVLLPVAAELKARRRLLERLQAAEALHRLILDRTGDVVLRTNVDGKVRYASPSLQAVWDLKPAGLIGRPVYALVQDDDIATLHDARCRALAAPDATVVVEYRPKGGPRAGAWVESHLRATIDSEGKATGLVSVIRETTERRQRVAVLEQEAATDALTGLANRRTFDRVLDDRLANTPEDRRIGCFAVVDLDHFKTINDRHGHAMGDAVLKHVAGILQSAVRIGDQVARLGGEEFGILLAGATIEQAYIVCEGVRSSLEARPIRSATNHQVIVTASVGIAEIERGAGARLAIETADAALYRAKAQGRNRLSLAA